MTTTDEDDGRNRVLDHYRRLLAPHYTWMLGGDIESVAAAQRELLAAVLPAADRGPAIDVGCGSGAQTFALADLGYAPVHAVDTDPALLDELRAHAGDRPAIDAVAGDAVTAAAGLGPSSVAVAVCMGDTLLHLPSAAAVIDLFGFLARALRTDGALVLTYRDLTPQMTGPDRFIPVRSDDRQIMTCFLDGTDPDVVEVHDIIHTRADGEWTMIVSSYPKLRLSAAWVCDHLSRSGLAVTHHEQGPSGMWRTVAVRRSTSTAVGRSPAPPPCHTM